MNTIFLFINNSYSTIHVGFTLPNADSLPLLKSVGSKLLITTSFKEIINGTNPMLIDAWIIKYKDTPYSRIKSFVNGINRDLDAVKNAIIYPWTNGIVEGSVNRLKNKKREMYGKAGFELLRKKVCLSTTG